MKKVITLLLVALISLPAFAKASENGIYIAPKVVLGFVDTDAKFSSTIGDTSGNSFSDTVFGGGLAVGYDFNPKFDFPIRMELEYLFFGKMEDGETTNIIGIGEYKAHGEANISTLMVNAYYDFENKTKFTPYVNLGFGMSFIGFETDVNISGLGSVNLGKETHTNFAWNVGLGLSYDFTDKFSIDFGYRYTQLGEAETQNLAEVLKAKAENINMHQLICGIRYTF